MIRTRFPSCTARGGGLGGGVRTLKEFDWGRRVNGAGTKYKSVRLSVGSLTQWLSRCCGSVTALEVLWGDSAGRRKYPEWRAAATGLQPLAAARPAHLFVHSARGSSKKCTGARQLAAARPVHLMVAVCLEKVPGLCL